MKQFSTILSVLFYVSLGVIKISITFFNLRLTALASKPWRIANKIFLAILFGYTFLALFWIIFQCNPQRYSFDLEYAGTLTEPPKCGPKNILAKTLSGLHSGLDFILLTTPIVVIWKVKMPRGDKIRLIGLFSMGSISVGASVGRILALEHQKQDFTCARHFCSVIFLLES